MPTTDLMNALIIDSVTFIPQWRQEFSRQAGGTPRVADIGPGMWLAKIAASVMENTGALQAEAIINKMRGSFGTFYVWDPRAQYPQADPGGVILGANVVTISELGVDNKSLRLTGLPVGYQITPGDFLAFDHGTTPSVHRCLHQFVESAVADGSGEIDLTEVAPHILPGATVGLVVSLRRPAAEMMILPGSYDARSNGPTISAISFTAIQVPVGVGPDEEDSGPSLDFSDPDNSQYLPSV